MSYTPTNWQTGDTITATKLNHMEDGIAQGDTLIVGVSLNDGTATMDKTWQEIYNAMPNAIIKTETEEALSTSLIVSAYYEASSAPSHYVIVESCDPYTTPPTFTYSQFGANAPDEYPTIRGGD